MCFCFIIRKNRNAGVVVPAAYQTGCTYMFYLSAYKNHSVKAAIAAAKVFLSKTFSAIFAFLFTKIIKQE